MSDGVPARRFLWVFSTFAIGGPQRRFVSLLPAFGADTEHLVLAMDANYEAECLLPPGMRLRRLDMTVEKTAFLSPRNIAQFRRALRDERPDLILTSNWGTIEWHMANRGFRPIPHIHFEDGFGPDEAAGARSSKRDLARRALFAPLSPGAGQRRFVAPSHGLADILTSAWGAPRHHVHLIPNGIDIDRFSAPQARAADAVSHQFTIGSVGALRPEKRFDRLIRAFAGMVAREPKDRLTKLLLVGDGPERGALQRLAADQGLADRIMFAGEQSDIAAFLAKMDIFALTSDTEQMPISLIEAMAARLPVVATDVGDVRVMMPDVQGRFIIPKADDEDVLTARLTEALCTLRDDGVLRGSLAVANRDKVGIYSFETMAAAYRDLVDGLLTSGTKR